MANLFWLMFNSNDFCYQHEIAFVSDFASKLSFPIAEREKMLHNFIDHMWGFLINKLIDRRFHKLFAEL